MKSKIDNAVTISEKVKIEAEAMDLQTRSLLRRLTLLMFIPGPRGAKKLAAMTSVYAHVINRVLNPKMVTKKYKEIQVADYSKDIERNIKKLDEVKEDLSKSSTEINKIISKIKNEFFDYIGVIPECDQLLSNLERVRSNIREKEYELDKIKIKQEKELERNNAKVLTKGTYPM